MAIAGKGYPSAFYGKELVSGDGRPTFAHCDNTAAARASQVSPVCINNTDSLVNNPAPSYNPTNKPESRERWESMRGQEERIVEEVKKKDRATVSTHCSPVLGRNENRDGDYRLVAQPPQLQSAPSSNGPHSPFCLPRIEVSPFSGDPAEHRTFIREFNEYIEKNTSNPAERLCHLVRLCKGAAASAVRGCRDMVPEAGLVVAKEALHREFGTDRKVQSAILQRLTRRKEGHLVSLEDDLCAAVRALAGLDDASELGTQSTLRTVSEQLPRNMHKFPDSKPHALKRLILLRKKPPDPSQSCACFSRWS